jgi:hypothetical protein
MECGDQSQWSGEPRWGLSWGWRRKTRSFDCMPYLPCALGGAVSARQLFVLIILLNNILTPAQWDGILYSYFPDGGLLERKGRQEMFGEGLSQTMWVRGRGKSEDDFRSETWMTFGWEKWRTSRWERNNFWLTRGQPSNASWWFQVIYLVYISPGVDSGVLVEHP